MMESWINIPAGSDFSIHNVPFGIYSYGNNEPRPATRIGNTVVDLSVLADFGYFDELDIDDLTVFYQPVLNEFIRLGKSATSQVRKRLIMLFSEHSHELREHKEACDHAFHQADSIAMHMPVKVWNYTDFYASEQHAYNIGVMFRDPQNALLPNWKHMPVAYHGRASSVVISGTPICRPSGQTIIDGHDQPAFGPTRQLDFELEMGFIIGQDSSLGTSINTSEAEDYIFGLVLFNDLSARDIQKWEYVPLGPFLGKNFGSVISPWIVMPEALEPFRIPGPVQSPAVLPYLQYEGDGHFDVELEVYIEPGSRQSSVVSRQSTDLLQHSTFNIKHSNFLSRSNLKYLYWNFKQMLAHHTINGCNIAVGDICATGTISGPDESTWGSLLELTWKGTKPIQMPDGSTRKFIEDFDTVVMNGHAERDDVRVGFGECRVTILPANYKLET